MPRIPESELERLKRDISLERLAEAAGIALKRHGADLLGLCPFHDDHEPSLVISPDKNLWHCLGACQAGACQVNTACATCQVCDLASYTCVSAKPDGYCKPCAGDADCGGGNNHCLTALDGQFCGKPCPASGCPKGFSCFSVTLSGGGTAQQCVPTDLRCTASGANKCGF